MSGKLYFEARPRVGRGKKKPWGFIMLIILGAIMVLGGNLLVFYRESYSRLVPHSAWKTRTYTENLMESNLEGYELAAFEELVVTPFQAEGGDYVLINLTATFPSLPIGFSPEPLEIRVHSWGSGIVYEFPYDEVLGDFFDNVYLPWTDTYQVEIANPNSFPVTVNAIFSAAGTRQESYTETEYWPYTEYQEPYREIGIVLVPIGAVALVAGLLGRRSYRILSK